MKRSPISDSTQTLGRFPSPGAPKGWNSERAPYPTSSSRRHLSAAAFTPFYSGRALPSKWEDAERWICFSPVSDYSVTNKNSLHSQTRRRPKSKSGPIVPPGLHYSSCSPAMHVLDGGNGKNFMAGSLFSTGVLVADGICINYGGSGSCCEQGYLVQNGSHVARSSGVPGWSDLVSEDTLPSAPDENLNDIADADAMVSRAASRREMATQMSPESSTNSSPSGKFTFSLSICSIVELQNENPAKLEVKEVQVDEGATMIRGSKRHGSRKIKKGLPDVEEFYQNVTDPCAPSLDLSEVATSISKSQREEAKIAAWENLQKAKAEAAIRKLEMKLQKERSHSTDKILNKLKRAQMKAQEMRSSISNKQVQEMPKTSHKAVFSHKNARMSSFRSCFTCHNT